MLALIATVRPANSIGRCKRALQPGRDALGLLILRAWAQDDELVAAEARQDVARAQRRFPAARHLDEQLVAGRVSERVVDQLELIDVGDQDGQRPPSRLAGAVERLLQFLQQGRAIRQAR